MKIKTAMLIAACALLPSCSRGVVRPGHDLRVSLPEKTHTLAHVWSGAGEALLGIGQPMRVDVYAEAHRISGSGIMVIEVRSHDFDPVAAVIDGTGRLAAFNDDWRETRNARIVLDGIPSGARLLVFSPDDSRGLYDVVVRQGTQADLDEFNNSTDLSSGEVTAWLSSGARNRVIEELLRDALQDQVYNSNYSRGRLYPFTVEKRGLVSISLESDEFDPFLVLMERVNGALSFVEYNDDYNGVWSRIIRELEPGEYMAVVLPYSESGHGQYTLRLESIDPEAFQRAGTDASAQGVEHSGEIVPGRNYALAWWPDMLQSWEAPSFLSPFSPAAPFTFTVQETAVYQLNALGDMDVCLTVLRPLNGETRFIAANDDHQGMGTNSRVRGILVPGDYAALVSHFYGTEQGQVRFSWSREAADVRSLRTGSSVRATASYETESLFYRFDVVQGRTYTLTVESSDLDPVITLYMPDGAVLSDDDGGEGTNSRLNFTVEEGQTGACFLQVDKYSPGDGSFTVLLEQGRQPGS